MEHGTRKHVKRHVTLCAAILMVWLAVTIRGQGATEHVGQVSFNGLPVPGASVTATHGEQRRVTTTNEQGMFKLANLGDGPWSIRIEMLGFTPVTRELDATAIAAPSSWELTLIPFEEIAKTLPPPAAAPAATAASVTNGKPPAAGTRGATTPAAAPPASNGFTRAGVTAAPRPATPIVDAPAPPAEAAQAADGVLINGSVNNGAASPFAQAAAFGNARRSIGSPYQYAAGFNADTSAWDSRPVAFNGQQPAKPSYTDIHVLGTFQGPLKIPGVVQKRPQLYVGYQRTSDHNATTQSTIVPTALERAGDFSQTRDAFGQSIRVIDPTTGAAFANNAIPTARISPQAAALLQYYPAPNLEGDRFNYQSAVLTATEQHNVQSRLTQPLTNRMSLLGTLNFTHGQNDTTSLFGFRDRTSTSGLDTTIQLNRRINPFFTIVPRYQFTRLANDVTPHFANLANVSGDAGITGTDPSALNWGPPSLVFSSGTGTLSDGIASRSRTLTHTAGLQAFLGRGRHSLQFGGDVARRSIDIVAQQDPRGRFTFTGAASGYDFADFLLGLPQTSSIAYGNADKYFRANLFSAFLTDDYRISPSLTLTAGVRWEYESPITETQGRLVNLDIASGFGAASPVIASDPTAPLTGTTYRPTLLRRDFTGIQPRTALAWRPVAGSSLIVRASYGIYRNTNVYQPIATLLAQQPPLSRTVSAETSAAHVLTLANGFSTAVVPAQNTFAVDPAFKVGYAQNWQTSLQRDLPGSMTVTLTYLGTHGSHLPQQILPNSYAPGADNPCPSCPLGFIYLTSNGTSDRHAGQFQLRRRLRNGLTWSTNYTIAKAEDNATAFTGASFAGNTIAQNWLDLDAERGPSTFDQRHKVTVEAQYTTGVGVAGGGMLTGVKGALIKNWTFSTQITAGSGLPVTPVYLTQVPGTAIIGSVRASLTGVSTADIPDGYYLNPAAYASPAAGEWGTAGRNSARGPNQFTMNLGILRTFPWGTRRNWDYQINITNLLNTVTYSAINTTVGTPQFGLPIAANPMRKISTSLRLRF